MTDDSVSRRSVLTGAAVAVAAAIAGFAVAKSSSLAKSKASTPGASGYRSSGSYGSSNGYSYGSGTSSTTGAPPGSGSSGPASGGTPLVPLAQVPSGGGIILAGHKLVVTRSASGSVHAFSAICTHMGCTVGSVENGKIICPCHGSVFNAWTGAVEQGPATTPLPQVPVTIRSNGIYES